MDVTGTTTSAADPAGGSSSTAPFLLKTYDMIDDPSTDSTVSWSPSGTSFVVWDPADLAARLLPSFFKHCNFSSFIRQLNTYGFHKIHPERWEFANDDFARGGRHLLRNIHRRKPLHSHSHPLGHPLDHERAALEEEIDRLAREKAAIQADLLRFQRRQPLISSQIGAVDRRLCDMERRQEKMLAFVRRAVHNPDFVEVLVKMAVAGSVPKKRRLPEFELSQEVAENGSYDDHCSTSKQEIGQVFQRDFCDKLRLELSAGGAQSSTEDQESLAARTETVELSDTGVSFCSKRSLLLSSSVFEEGEGLVPCHLNLTLASSSMQMGIQERGTGHADEMIVSSSGREEESGVGVGKNQDTVRESYQGTATTTQAVAANATGRVNDVFWEQFLTERPGSSETEEASSGLKVNANEEQQEERRGGSESTWRSKKDLGQLSL